MPTDLNYKNLYENEREENARLKEACRELTSQNHKLAVEATQLMIKLAEITR